MLSSPLRGAMLVHSSRWSERFITQQQQQQQPQRSSSSCRSVLLGAARSSLRGIWDRSRAPLCISIVLSSTALRDSLLASNNLHRSYNCSSRSSRCSSSMASPASPSPCRSKEPEIVCGDGGLRSEVLSRMSSLRRPYEAPLMLSNRHAETIFAAFFRSHPQVRYRRECLRMIDGGTVALDWPVLGDGEDLWKQKPAPNAPVLILLPGLTGGSHDSYVKHLLVKVRQKGWNPVVFNSRGCSDSPVTSPKFYSASFTEDLRQVVRFVAHRFPSSRIYAAGWSLGANILVRYVAQEGDMCQLAAAVSLCNPFNLVIADEDFHKGFNNIYDKSLAKSLRRIFRKHHALFEGIGGQYNIQKAANAKSVRDFDDGLTRVAFGYASVDEYYCDASSSRSIKDVQIPLLCIQAENDPIAPSRGIPRADIEANENCLLIVTPKGGHLGWVAGKEAPFGAPWTDPVVLEYLETMELLYNDNKATLKYTPKQSEHLEIVWAS